ncbi:TPA: glycosyltransferase [Streptococcus suis]|nr:glycosyltransferase [Streptococcus suis]
MEQFSLLMSVYHGDSPDFIRECLDSLLASSVLPDQFVLVQDGPISKEVESIIVKYQSYFKLSQIVKLERNSGLGVALAVGLDNCIYDLVARFDCDDLVMPDRFKRQLETFAKSPNLVLLGGQIKEFSDQVELRHRTVPTTCEEIYRFSNYRNPFNHMTVMFRKSAVLSVGSYQSLIGYEDYYLWLRLIKHGYYMENLPEILVKARAGRSLIHRRGGFKYLKQSIYAIKKFEQEGLISSSVAYKRKVIQTIIFILPAWVREMFYTLILRKK